MKILRNLWKPLLWLMGVLVPKDPNLVVFSQNRGRFSDNARALFEWMTRDGSHLVVWLYTGEPPQTDLKGTYVRRDTWQGAWVALRARVAVLSHGVNDFDRLRYGLCRARHVMLWHAIMVKSAYVTDTSMTERQKRRYWRREARHFDRVIASSEIDRYHTAAYMGVRADRVVVTGLPRQDAVNHAMTHRPSRPANSPVQVLYAPTYRDTPTARGQSLFFPFPEWHEADFAAFCRRHYLRLMLRPHPNDRVSLAHVDALAERWPDVFTDATVNAYPDTVRLLPQVDAVVTDYSSIYLDLLPFSMPCIFIPFDIDDYDGHRGLAYPYDLITPGPKVATATELTTALADAAAGAPDWADRREQVCNLFFQYRDEDNCRRTAAVVHELLR